MRKPLVDAVEAAAIIGETERGVYRLVAAGIIPHYRDGRAVRFHRAEIERWRDHGRADELRLAVDPQVQVVQTEDGARVTLTLDVRMAQKGGAGALRLLSNG